MDCGQTDEDEKSLDDEWFHAEMQEIWKTEEAEAADDLEKSLRTLERNEQLPMASCFRILKLIEAGEPRVLSRLPVRSTASPFPPARPSGVRPSFSLLSRPEAPRASRRSTVRPSPPRGAPP